MSRCPSCKKFRDHFHYLCGNCFHALPDAAQLELLPRRDHTVIPRLRQVYAQLEQNVPLKKIRIEVGGRG